MKFQKKVNGTFKLQGDFVYPSKLYKKHFTQFKEKLHSLDMKFYCGENRLRSMSDELCCCGVEGLGWKVNTANINHYIYDRKNFVFTESMKKEETGGVFYAILQSAESRKLKHMPYEKLMNYATNDRGIVRQLIED